MVAADVTGCAKTPKWHFGRTKKGFSDPSPPKKTRHIETVEVVFPGSPAGEEFSHSLLPRRLPFADTLSNFPDHIGHRFPCRDERKHVLRVGHNHIQHVRLGGVE